MELSIYDVIRKPRITTKVYRLNKELRQLVLEVHPAANKPMIAQALNQIFNMKVKSSDVRVANRKGKQRFVKRRPVQGTLMKVAYVSLAAGQSIDMVDWTGAMGATPAKT